MEYLNSLKLLWNYLQAVSKVFDALIQPSKNSNYFDYVNVRISCSAVTAKTPNIRWAITFASPLTCTCRQPKLSLS